MHQTSHSSSAPRRTASLGFASLIQTESTKSFPSRSTAGISIGSETPATSKSWSTSRCGTAQFVFSPKSQTLKVPSMPSSVRMRAASMPRCG